MSRIQKYSVEEFVNKAKANTKPEVDSRLASTKLRMWDGKV
jgi:hypothetical protein